jgi:putative flippase GtrA
MLAPLKSGVVVRLLRFGVTGILSNGLLLALFAGLTRLGAPVMAASVLVYGAGVLVSYFVNRNWSFSSSRPHREGAAFYLLTQLFGLMIVLLMQWGLHGLIGLPGIVVQAMAIPVVALLSFVLLEWIVFPRRHSKSIGGAA